MHMLLNFFLLSFFVIEYFRRLYIQQLPKSYGVWTFFFFALNIYSEIACLKTPAFNLLLMKYTRSKKRSRKFWLQGWHTKSFLFPGIITVLSQVLWVPQPFLYPSLASRNSQSGFLLSSFPQEKREQKCHHKTSTNITNLIFLHNTIGVVMALGFNNKSN